LTASVTTPRADENFTECVYKVTNTAENSSSLYMLILSVSLY